MNVRELFHGLPNLEIKCHRQMNYFGFQTWMRPWSSSPPKIIQQSPFDALPRPFDEKIVLFFSPSPSSCRILGHLHPKTPPKIIYPSLHSIESICQGFILWGATGWWRPKIIFSMLTVVFWLFLFSCSFQGLVTIGLLWIVFFLVFFWMGIYLVGCGEVATLQNNFFHLLEMCFFIFWMEFIFWDMDG